MNEIRTPDDNIIQDIKAKITASRGDDGFIDEAALLAELAIYLVGRDFKVFNHGFSMGQKARKEAANAN